MERNTIGLVAAMADRVLTLAHKDIRMKIRNFMAAGLALVALASLNRAAGRRRNAVRTRGPLAQPACVRGTADITTCNTASRSPWSFRPRPS